jgi:hypothetical protein
VVVYFWTATNRRLRGALWSIIAPPFIDTLLFLKDDQIVNAAESPEWPSGLTMLGEDVALWRKNQLQVMDGYGRLLWSVEFSKRISGVSVHGDLIISAAGAVLAGFCRRAG